jgi:DNA-directed RNA polymerase subunit RPC12/RpoP
MNNPYENEVLENRLCYDCSTMNNIKESNYQGVYRCEKCEDKMIIKEEGTL